MTDWLRALSDAGKKWTRKKRGQENASKPTEELELKTLLGQSLEELRAMGVRSGKPELASLKVTEPPSAWRSLWLGELVRQCGRAATERASCGQVDSATLSNRTDALLMAIFAVIEDLAGEYNTLVGPRMGISMTKPSVVRETTIAETRVRGAEEPPSISYLRCRASTPSLCLSVRGREGIVEFYVLPASEIFLLSEAETESRLMARLRFDARIPGGLWTLDGFPLDEPELKVIIRDTFKEFVLRSAGEIMAEVDTHGIALHLEGERLTQAIKELVLQRENLVHKVLLQQEEIQNRIARDLHDVVIADVMMLKRSLSGDRELNGDEVIAVLNRLSQRLREICHDLAPRDLRDWGLPTVIEDLLNRIEERTGAECTLVCDGDVPELPGEVQLHVYRIVQESLNNVEKYAQATRVVVNIEVVDDTLVFEIKDDGIGFDLAARLARRGREGGIGMGSIRERTELIRSYLPARLTIDSRISGGTTTKLELKLVGTFDDVT